MAKGKRHSDETRTAVMAALLTGQAVCQIAEQYRLPESTARAWRDTLSTDEILLQKSPEIERHGLKLLPIELREKFPGHSFGV